MSLADDIAAAIVTMLAPVVSANNGSGPFHQVVPQTTAAFPRIIFDIESDRDENDTPTRAKDILFSVKVISATGFKQANNILDACDALLHDGTFALTGWHPYWLMRESSTPRRADPREGGGYFYQTGATYRLKVEKEL